MEAHGVPPVEVQVAPMELHHEPRQREDHATTEGVPAGAEHMVEGELVVPEGDSLPEAEHHPGQVTPQAADVVPIASKDVSTWTTQEVSSWLEMLELGQYIPIFNSNHVTGSVLLKLDRDSLKELVPSVGHRVILLDSLTKLDASLEHPSGPGAAAQYLRNMTGWHSVDVRGHLEPFSLSPDGSLALTRLTGQMDPLPRRRGRQKQSTRSRVFDGVKPPEGQLQIEGGSIDGQAGELMPQQIKMSFIDRIRYVHAEYVRVKSQQEKADRVWRREVCKKIGLRIDENKLADSLRWHDNLFQIAFREGEIWELQDQIFNKWLRWEVKGQREAYGEQSGSKRRRRSEHSMIRNPNLDEAPGMPLLPWRALQGISSREAIKDLLQRVVNGELSMKEMEELGNDAKSLERMRNAFTELTKSESWQQCADRFPHFTTDEALAQFHTEFQKKRSNEERRNKLIIPAAFVAHVETAVAWEYQLMHGVEPTKDEHRDDGATAALPMSHVPQAEEVLDETEKIDVVGDIGDGGAEEEMGEVPVGGTAEVGEEAVDVEITKTEDEAMQFPAVD